MTGLIFKLIACPLILTVTNLILGNSRFDYLDLIILGGFLAVVLHIIELFSLDANNVWIITTVDFIVAFAVIYLGQFAFNTSSISLDATTVAAVLVNISEYFQHNWLLLHKKVS